jgi:hypothetical protein
MSEVKVNKISPRTNCGTVQLGDSGDTITIPAGATITNNGTQTGFGRTGAVDWDTTAKTASFTAVSGDGYFVNTTSGAITVTLPAGSAGSIVSLKDYANTWQTNNVTVTPNGTDKINGVNGNATLSTQDQSVTLVYVDSTKGWRAVQDSTSDVSGSSFIVATGGTITCCGDYKIHTFTSPGTFCVSVAGGPLAVADYLVIAGGGGGSGGTSSGSGGGGAGGYRESKCATTSGCWTSSPLASSTSLPISISAYPVTVGAGGAGNSGGGTAGSNGSNSIFSTITSTGGGGGITCGTGNSGGSGGGSFGSNPTGTGNTPPVSPPQGNPGAAGVNGPNYTAGGGGGATGAGQAGTVPSGGNGGAGATSSINATPTARAGGGGGGIVSSGGGTPGLPAGCGTAGGGNGGGPCGPSLSTAGTANTGGGGGGGGGYPVPVAGSSGGSGIVIIRYKYQ